MSLLLELSKTSNSVAMRRGQVPCQDGSANRMLILSTNY